MGTSRSQKINLQTQKTCLHTSRMENWSDSIISATRFRQTVRVVPCPVVEKKIFNSSKIKKPQAMMFFYNPIIFIMDYGKTFFSLVDVVNVYGDKNFLSGVHTQKI